MDCDLYLIFHLSTGDNFKMYPVVLHFCKQYKKVNIYSLDRNFETVSQLYEKYDNIIIHKLDKNYNCCTVPSTELEKIQDVKNSKILLSGFNNPNWYSLTLPFYRRFYEQLNLSYDIKYKYDEINRNYEKENKLLQNIINTYKNEYIFIHDRSSFVRVKMYSPS